MPFRRKRRGRGAADGWASVPTTGFAAAPVRPERSRLISQGAQGRKSRAILPLLLFSLCQAVFVGIDVGHFVKPFG